MKRLSKASRLVIALLAAGLIAGAAGGPANAGSFEWADPADDAKNYYVLANTPLPSEPTLDILKTTMHSDDKNLTWAVHVKKLAAAPAIAPGYFFRFNFIYGGQGFVFRAGKDPAQNLFQFRTSTDNVGIDLPCKGCAVKYDMASNQVVMTAPIASIIEGVAAADKSCPGCRGAPAPAPLAPLAKGAEFTGLVTNGQYFYVRGTFNADTSTAPEGSTFTL